MAFAANWKPKRTIEECTSIMTSPGMMHEMELAIINGRATRVYKNTRPSLRTFWLEFSQAWSDRTFLVFENERYTFRQVYELTLRLASLLHRKYHVRKGDRVAIAMRNFPEFIISFWAIQLLGGVSTFVNAWLPPKPFLHCIKLTDPKVIIVDPERADRISGTLLDVIKEKSSLTGILVVRSRECRSTWDGMEDFDQELSSYSGPLYMWKDESEAMPEDDATIFFTSGTTGLPKGVLSSQRGFLGNIFNAIASRYRRFLRKGEDIPLADTDQKAVLIAVPLFHVTACISNMLTAVYTGANVVLMRRWDKENAVKLIVAERITSLGGVPSTLMDTIESSLQSDTTIESLSTGGAPAAETLAKEVVRRFPNAVPIQGYGLSETNSIACSFEGEDFLAHPASTGLPPPVVDMIIVDPATKKILPPNQIGELWIKGPNLMKGYWNDPEATAKTITPDGWLKSGDLAVIDEEGFVYIKDRIKDIIIRGGENIPSVEVENAMYADERIFDAAAVSVPDRRLNELVAAIVSTKPAWRGKVKEEEVIAIAKKTLPLHAVPVMVLVQDEPLEKNPNGKIMKDLLRIKAREEWAKRQQFKSGTTIGKLVEERSKL